MTLLSSIHTDVEQVAEAISLAIGCDIEVIDPQLVRIAATGKLKGSLGQPLRHGHIYSFLMQYKQPFVLDNPGSSQLCASCNLKGNCYYKTGLSSPILLDGVTLGIISINAFEEEKAAYIRKNLNELMGFANKMAELLASKARERELSNSLRITTTELMAILNTDSRGVIAVNDAGQVLHYNEVSLALLGVARAADATAALERVLSDEIRLRPKSTVQKVINNRCLLVSVESVPVSLGDREELLWLVICRDYASVKRSASSITLQDNIIGFESIFSRSEKMAELVRTAKKIARNSSTVLIMGESGTGKEMLARAIHSESGRLGHLIPINCGAIPEALLESELFGYEPGAFTGARKEGKPGKFELAEGGTLFLDEIGTMPLHLQSKLLRVLEDRRLEHLGGRYSIPLDVRIIAATNEDLEKRVREGSFREDLFFRINVIPFRIPPLRERQEDIPLLADHFLRLYAGKFGKTIRGIDEGASVLIRDYPWPGNIRELSNAIEFAVNMEDGDSLRAESLPPSLRNNGSTGKRALQNIDQLITATLRESLDRYGHGEKGKQRAAEALGVSQATIYRWVKKYNCERPDAT